MTDAELSDALQGLVAARTGRDGRVVGLEPLAGGASRRIYGFELALGPSDRGRPMVLRMDSESGPLGTERREEYALLAAVREAGVTVPAVHWYGDAEDGLGASYIVMERVDGEALGRHLLRDAKYERTRSRLPRALASELAAIHAVDTEAVGVRALAESAPAGDARRFARTEVARYRDLLAMTDADHPRPALVLARRWLERNAPAAERATLVHGDFRIGNILFDEAGLTAVLDWELAHVGDPLEDIGWLAVRAWRYGADAMPIGGLCERREFWDLYERASGFRVDPEAARYWEIFGNWKWAIICIVQTAAHKAGRHPNVELASLGRRVAEVEWELLNRLEHADRERPNAG